MTEKLNVVIPPTGKSPKEIASALFDLPPKEPAKTSRPTSRSEPAAEAVPLAASAKD